jgi:hypothetical protein
MGCENTKTDLKIGDLANFLAADADLATISMILTSPTNASGAALTQMKLVQLIIIAFQLNGRKTFTAKMVVEMAEAMGRLDILNPRHGSNLGGVAAAVLQKFDLTYKSKHIPHTYVIPAVLRLRTK